MKKNNLQYQLCSNCIMDTTDTSITFNSDGICDYCINFEKNIKSVLNNHQKKNKILVNKLEEIKKSKKSSKYDCIIGISGGIDSCYLAFILKEVYQLEPLVLHVDTGWNSKESVNNIEKIVDGLNLDLFTKVINWREMKDLQLSFFKAQHPNLDIPQDHAIFASLYNFAIENKIKYILTGGNLATECLREPLEWAYHASDVKHIKWIHKKFGTEKLKNFPLCDIFVYKIFYRFFYGLKVFQPLNYIEYNKSEAIKLLEKNFGWEKYSHKHFESRFTKFYEGFWLLKKFGYDKRKAHFSSLILTGQMKREEALVKIKNQPYDDDEAKKLFDYVCEKLEVSPEYLKLLMSKPNKSFKDYKSNYQIINFFVKLCRFLKIENRLIR